MKFTEKRDGFGVEKILHFPQFSSCEKSEKNAPKPIHSLASQTILGTFPRCEKSYQLVTFQKMS